MKNTKKIFLTLLIFILFGIIGSFVFIKWIFPLPPAPPPKKSVDLSFVGSYDDRKEWDDIIAKFKHYKSKSENEYILVNISYERICDPVCESLENYKKVIEERQAQDNGPNIFMIFNTWLPKYEKELLPMPKEIMSVNQFEDTFAKVAVDDLIKNERIYALPFYIDTLALFYNEDMFNNENYKTYPKNWSEFEDYTEKFTKFDENGNIEIAGATFGGGNNVTRSQDIIMLLVMQNNMQYGENIASFNNIGSEPAIKFYTEFTNPKKRFYTWNENQMYSIDAFTSRKAAMMINYSYGIQNIISKTGNTLNFKVVPMPQLDENNKVNYARYWVPVVPKDAFCKTDRGLKIDCQELAWEFLNFAAQKENTKLYLDVNNKPAANKELAIEQCKDDSNVKSSFACQVFTAKSWYHPDDSKSDKYLDEMINSITTTTTDKKKGISEAMEIVKKQVSELN